MSIKTRAILTRVGPLENSYPKSSSFPTGFPEPPPENCFHSNKTCTPTNATAKVARAKYNSLTRKLGNPTISPKRKATPNAIGSSVSSPLVQTVVMFADKKTPAATKIVCPSVNCPAIPKTTIRLAPIIAKIIVFMIV